MIIPANMLTSVLVPGHINTASHHGCKGCGTCYFSAGTARACFFSSRLRSILWKNLNVVLARSYHPCDGVSKSSLLFAEYVYSLERGCDCHKHHECAVWWCNPKNIKLSTGVLFTAYRVVKGGGSKGRGFQGEGVP